MRILFLLALLAAPAAAQDLVAKTEARSPEEERKTFKLQAGFEAQLVASEPEIQKPMQLAFDAKNRIWVTTSHHYPFAAKPGEGTDKLFILSDFDATGKAKTVRVFDDKLNIPIGVLPLPDGKSAVVGECGSILKLTDTDGDGKADARETLFTGFGYDDTHGMTNSYTLLPDGWIYACHGFKNKSRVKGRDGHEITMESGHTFRFKPDGSRIEIFTKGQVNPFGMCVDPWLNLYTADCHSRPMTQLIRGACYQSFGKPHDGLGFAPHLFNHQHDSTGLCGIAYYAADYYPKDWNGVMFVGNVVTSRINCDRITWTGSSPSGREMPDFLVSGDPWFRPVDLKIGPDGAMYVNDFYNRIVGHYEVDLKHPGRDKDRGRIWRIIRTGSHPRPAHDDWTALQDPLLVDYLGDANLSVALTVANELARRGQFAWKPEDFIDAKAYSQRAGLVAMLRERNGTMEMGRYPKYFEIASRTNRTVPSGSLLIKALAMKPEWSDRERKLVLEWFATVGVDMRARAIVEAVALHPHADFVTPLLNFLGKQGMQSDTHLHMATRIALRECIIAAGGIDKLGSLADRNNELVFVRIYDIALGLRTPEAYAFLAQNFDLTRLTIPQRLAAAEIIGQHAPEHAAKVIAANSSLRDVVGRALMQGLQRGGARALPPALIEPYAIGQANRLRNENPYAPSLLQASADFKLATSFPESAAAFAPLECTRLALILVEDAKAPLPVRLELVDALRPIASRAIEQSFRTMLSDAEQPAALRFRIAAAKASPETQAVLRDLMKTAAYPVSVEIAAHLAGDAAGAEILLTSVKAGESPARLLQEKAVVARLKAAKVPDLDARLAELTRNLPNADKKLDDLLKARAENFRKQAGSPHKGFEVFKTHCAACHQIGREGAKVGPQLDGIGIRGLERLLEDVLDPNRHVDHAFRSTRFDLKDGRNVSGLLLREEGAVYVVADALGKEVRLSKEDVETKTASNLSAMPGNFDTAVPEGEFQNLMAYLLSQRAKK